MRVSKNLAWVLDVYTLAIWQKLTQRVKELKTDNPHISPGIELLRSRQPKWFSPKLDCMPRLSN
jgi:hypothetical protein